MLGYNPGDGQSVAVSVPGPFSRATKGATGEVVQRIEVAMERVANQRMEQPTSLGCQELNTGASDDSLIPLPMISAGWPEGVDGGCVLLDPVAVLRANGRSFALRVRGYSMVGANIYDGDIVVGEFTPEARPGAIVVALIDGESALKRLIMHRDRPYLKSENPNCPDLVPLSELVVQGVVHTVVHRLP